jgi:hypothetical protein
MHGLANTGGCIEAANSQSSLSWIAALPKAAQRLIILVAIAFSILPLGVVTHYPLLDYPNHLGRFQIYHTLSASPALQEFWEWHWAIIPNLAVDLAVIPLLWFMPVEQAANLVILLVLVLLCIGTILIDRQLNGPNWGLSLFTGILLYNGAFRYGFVTFIAAVAVALFAFAAWLRWRERVVGLGFVGFVTIGTVLFIMHLYGLGLYGLAVAGYELTVFGEQLRDNRQKILQSLRVPTYAAATLLLPLLLLLLSPTSNAAAMFSWRQPWLWWKLSLLISPIFFNMPIVELPLLLVLGSLLITGLATRTVLIHPRMIIFVGLVSLLFFVMPYTIFSSSYADYRLLSGASFFFLRSLRLNLTSSRRRHEVFVLLCFILIVRVGSILVNWLAAQPILAEYDHALATLPPGAKILVLDGALDFSADQSPTLEHIAVSLNSKSDRRSPPLEHIAVFAAAKQQDFVSYTFHTASLPLRIRRPYASYHYDANPKNAREMARFDYLLAIRRPNIFVPKAVTLQKLTEGRSYQLFKIERH